MALKAASSRLFVTLEKTRATLTALATAEVRLTSGQVDSKTETLTWTAYGHSRWLRMGSTVGAVDSSRPVSEVGFVVDVSGLNDTAGTPHRTAITVTSRILVDGADRSELFENGTQALHLDVELTIVAVAYLAPSDVLVQNSVGDVLTDGAVVAAGDTLTLSTRTFDCERLPIARSGARVVVSLGLAAETKLSRSLEMQYRADNRYQAEIPSAWIETPARYVLHVQADGGSGLADAPVVVTLEVRKDQTQLYIAIGIGSVRCHLSTSLWYLR
jgi:hypothetical protein